nr:MAG TPA: hypothetical protein [Caudoviricetes sp.]
MREDSSWWFNSTARRECGASPHVGFANRMNSVKKGFSALLRYIAY